MSNQPKHDNKSLERKVALRHAALHALRRRGIEPVVMEAYGGYGALYARVYGPLGVQTGCVLEKDRAKALHLARQRPSWTVYAGNTVAALRAGAGAHLPMPVTLLDLDPYGEPWPALSAFLDSLADGTRPGLAPVRELHIVVTDGARQGAQRQRAWTWNDDVLQEMVACYGNDGVWTHYLDVAREVMATKLAQADMRLSQWTGYYCGYRDQMTHYYAVAVPAVA